MAKVSTLIADALKTAGIVGVGQTALAEDTNFAFRALNRLLAEWRRLRIYVYHFSDVSFTGTGAQSYTIGPTGADITAPRPNRIEAAFVRQNVAASPYPTDRPLRVLRSREDYNNIAVKNVTPYPLSIFYDATYPNGVVYPVPVPSSLYEIHMTVFGDLAAFATLNDNFNFPDEYENALYWNLVKSLRTAYRRPADSEINISARRSRMIITKANLQIPALTMPDGIPLNAPRYNILSDQGR